MNTKVNPVVATVVAVVVLIGVVLVGMKMTGGSAESGSEGKAVIVNPKNPNDPKFTEHLPKNLGGGALNNPP